MQSSGLPPVISAEHSPARLQEVISGIARTTRVMVLYGDVEVQQGLEQVFDVPYGPHESRRMNLRTLMQELRPTAGSLAMEHNPFALAALNKIMTERRIAARSAPTNALSQFLVRLDRMDRLCLAISLGFDMSGTTPSSLDENTLMLHGDNRLLKCCGPRCPGLDAEATRRFDYVFSDLDDVHGKRRKCPYCYHKFVKDSKKKRRGNERTYSLRPAVDLQLAESMIAGTGKMAMMEAAKSSQLLLIIGTTLKSPLLRELVQDLADVIQTGSGAVVLVHPEALQGKNLFNCINFHLGLEPEQALEMIEAEMQKRTTGALVQDAPIYNELDFWVDIVGNEVPVEQRAEEPLWYGRLCKLCGYGDEEYLVECIECGADYCYRRVNYDESEGAEYDNGYIPPLDMPDPAGEDSYCNVEACLALHYFTADGRRPPLAEALCHNPRF
ncbi:Hydrocephalus-inducing protein [Ceratobasidium sp. AG-Ba]|nr:Hydrocephalus-inducing protein [Ceratobasidium sp. AG-Ba]